ncbi:hypothetical protein O9G_005780 [Rozella allomycis CSF55]|uniref:Enkurin domain-containing protein n=1 Tax=Rozella allomycis (strain CSF55) TaxID=988480 RepID=A0A075AMN4_ROZAC|nr:hypothetical protein O9G_005780 [Rozella allomycis CSF55]|eukprot:EPZ30893.1 hypothetical protein O9G_005780 [Rozella allomycis CSF55]
MEAKKRLQNELSGSSIQNYLQPSKGIRDDIRRNGGTPKNHASVNVRYIKDLESKIKQNRLNKEKQQVEQQAQIEASSVAFRHEIKINTPGPQRKIKLGELPSYLIDRKREQLEEELRKREKTFEKKVETLESLRANLQELFNELRTFPIASDSRAVKLKRNEIEKKIKQVEDAIHLFDQTKVYVAI